MKKITGLFWLLPLAWLALAPAAQGRLSIIGPQDDAIGVESFLVGLGSGDSGLGARYASVLNSVAYLDEGCTGWLLTPHYLVTNQHCLKDDYHALSAPAHPLLDDYDQEICDRLEIRFDYQDHRTELGNYAAPASTRFHCRRVAIASQALDLAIIELDHAAPESLQPLKLARDFRPSGQAVFMVGHPDARPKQIVYQNTDGKSQPAACIARPARYAPGMRPEDDPHPHHTVKNPHSFVHECDSIGGSSGSPVLDAKSLRVVGLHWNGWGDCKWMHYDPQGKIDDLNQRNGGGEEPRRSQDRRADRVRYRQGNSAILIDHIRAAMEKLPLGEGKGQLPAEIREALDAP